MSELTETAVVLIGDRDFTVNYTFYEGKNSKGICGGYFQGGAYYNDDPDEVEIDSILESGVEVVNTLDDTTYKHIQETLYAQHR